MTNGRNRPEADAQQHQYRGLSRIVSYLGNLDAPPPANPAGSPAKAPSNAISRQQWREQQLQNLMNDTNLNYDEYVKRREAIMAE